MELLLNERVGFLNPLQVLGLLLLALNPAVKWNAPIRSPNGKLIYRGNINMQFENVSGETVPSDLRLVQGGKTLHEENVMEAFPEILHSDFSNGDGYFDFAAIIESQKKRLFLGTEILVGISQIQQGETKPESAEPLYSVVSLVATELGRVPGIGKAYHTSILIDGEEYYFGLRGLSKSDALESHWREWWRKAIRNDKHVKKAMEKNETHVAERNRQIQMNRSTSGIPSSAKQNRQEYAERWLKDAGFVEWWNKNHKFGLPPGTTITGLGYTRQSASELIHALQPCFTNGSYDLMRKNCNSFSDVALFFLLGERLPAKYKRLDNLARPLASRKIGQLARLLGLGIVPTGYERNPQADGFNVKAVLQELTQEKKAEDGSS